MLTPELLTEALVVRVGEGQLAWPQRSEERLVTAYGRETAIALLPVLQRLAEEFYESDAAHTEGDHRGRRASGCAPVPRQTSGIGDAGVEALAWYYTFDGK